MSKTIKRIAFINLKGGVGKTNLSVNFAASCGENGHKTLLIDMDHQTNATFASISPEKWKEHSEKKGTLANILDLRLHKTAAAKTDNKNIIYKDAFKNVDLIPSHLELYTVDIDLAHATMREFKLKKAMAEIEGDYEYVIIDCPPNLNIATQNALAYCDYFCVPVSPDYLSGIGVGLLLARIDELSKDLNNEIKNLGIVFSRVGRPSYHREEVKEDIRKRFKNLVLQNEIKEKSPYSEAASIQKRIFDYDKGAGEEFQKVAAELFSRLK